MAGYLYLVCRKPGLPPTRLARLAAHLAGPALGPVLAVVLLATGLAAWIIAAVMRPLAVKESMSMALICLVFTVMCVRSFIRARVLKTA